MNTETFLENFHTIANAPGGIARLREMILQLAVQGKLVEQNPNDEPASALLKKIEAEKEKELTMLRQAQHKHPGTKNTKGGIEAIKDEDKPYKLPSNWEWVRLDWLGITQTGTTPPTKDPSNYGNFIPFIGPGNIKDGKIDYKKEGLSKKGINYSRLIPAKSILMVCIGGSIGKSAINEIDITCNQQINFITPFKNTDTRYLYYSMKSPTFQGKVISSSRGLATPIINKNTWSLLPISLPPLAEQKRIVAKVDSLMALCDRLEALQKKKEELNSLTRKTAFTALGNANEPSELKAAWTRLEENTKYLLDSEEALEEMKKTILQNAIKGNLVPQDPNDEPASELLKKIEVEKESLTTKSAKNTKGGGNRFDAIKDEEIPFTIQKGWEWIRLGNLVELITKGSSPTWQGIRYTENPNDLLFITSENVRNYELKLDKVKYVEWRFNEIEPRSILRKNDILMNLVGGSIGRTALYHLDKVANINQATCIIRMNEKLNNLRFFLHFFNSPTCLNYMFDKQVSNARENLSMESVRHFPIPLPPLEEQKRIVEKVDSLFALCDRLQKQLADAKDTAANLAKAAVESLTGIQSTEKEKMKTPKTELVSILRLSKAPTVKDKAPLSAILLKYKESMSAKNLWLNSGMEIDQFYQQLKSEMANGWIVEPEKAYMQVVE